MISALREFISKHNLIEPDDKILVALSGGIDSMVLFHLLYHAGFKVSIAHCNFGLRGKESDEDEAFVNQFAKQMKVPYFTEYFQTSEYAKGHKLSIQMAAREIRYDWLEHIRNECDYRYIAIAHNLDDNVETLLINLSRGTGIRGLAGIPVKSGSIIRPLLFAQRKEIIHYSRENLIEYREDSSNASTKYRRNFIRHKIVPLFREINPSFAESAGQLIESMNLVKAMYLMEMDKLEKEAVQISPLETKIRIEILKNREYSGLFLHEFLSVLGFSSKTTTQILKSYDSEPGKVFYSPTHRLLKDRDDFIITSRDSGVELKYYIDEDVTDIYQPVSLQFEFHENDTNFNIPSDSSTACLDYHQLHFPLILRKWQKGDYFQPLGMKGLKKLSDFFIDNKLSLVEKENTWILASGNKIVWVVGQRIDERFKIRDKTLKIWVARLVEIS